MLLKKCLLSGKNKLITVAIMVSVLILTTACSLISSSEQPKTTPSPDASNKKPTTKNDTYKGEVIYSLDFAQKSSDDARKWLKKKDFEFKSAAESQSKLAVTFANESLVLDAKEKLFGLIINGKLNLKDAKKIKITWGVDKYPKGASYEKGVNNEAIMVYVYFGDKKLSSGSMFIPNGPYFLGLYLGETDKINNPFTGRHFKEGGRFICLANPKPGETITSEFDLDKGFKDSFGESNTVPFISGVALEVETSSTTPSKSFIKKIEFLR